jgi:putative flippase GtrA
MLWKFGLILVVQVILEMIILDISVRNNIPPHIHLAISMGVAFVAVFYGNYLTIKHFRNKDKEKEQ